MKSRVRSHILVPVKEIVKRVNEVDLFNRTSGIVTDLRKKAQESSTGHKDGDDSK